MLMQKMNGLILALMMLLVMSVETATSNPRYLTEIDRMAEQAWAYYKKGDYKASQKIVDKNYSRESLVFSLLSGMLYVKENRCGQALSKIEYVINYLDANINEVKENSKTKDYYLNLKRLKIECDSKLGLWSELVYDLKTYLPHASAKERLVKTLMLGDALLKVSESSVNKGINVCEKVLSNADATKINEYAEHCLYVHVKLYGYSGEHKKAIDSLVRLLSSSSDKEKWVAEIEGSHSHKWMLVVPAVSDVLEQLKGAE